MEGLVSEEEELTLNGILNREPVQLVEAGG